MMPLGYSEINNENNKITQNKKKNKRKTIKKRISNNKVEKFLNSMNIKETFNNGNHNKKENDSSRKTIRAYESDDEEYGEPYERENEEKIVSEKNNNETSANIMNWDKEKLESFGLLKEGINQQEEYQKEQTNILNQYIPTYTATAQNIPYYTQLANSQNITGSRDDLMRKLNYVVHMLEEQQDEKTGNVTEELVLYMFLGVFVIFVVDSFARVSKYTR